ncbi:MAG: glycogen synthase GlgA [Gammaproteobacteria bacterium]|nr:glycogen synthase GlgA [Gammaproteobacteria bacterium]
MKKILFVTSEVYPLSKTGGLADVSQGLPTALTALSQDVRVLTPAYPEALEKLPKRKTRKSFRGDLNFDLIQSTLPGTQVPVWLVDIPKYFHRYGGPYQTVDGYVWPDNAERFHAFAQVANLVARNLCDLDWSPDIVHNNDWQTGLVPAYLESSKLATVFTIHNLAYQGQFSRWTFDRLGLPEDWWSMEGLEFHGNMSFMKAGLNYSDVINTVSPSYAKEIQTPAFGNGLEGLLQHHSARLYGILNGIDEKNWSPVKDKYLEHNYSYHTIKRKQLNKFALQRRFGLSERADIPLIGMVGRMVEQKGFDLVLESLSEILALGVQLVILGSGDKALEQDIAIAAKAHSDQIALVLGYDEALAHQIEAGADIFLMPSRFEPCGLNQMYSSAYGTIPIVHHVGGLADSVVDTNFDTEKAKTATGFHFYDPTSRSLVNTVKRAVSYFRSPKAWRRLIRAGMEQDFSWKQAAQDYLALYDQAMSNKGRLPGKKQV